jgi:hypothetical protein
VSVNPIVWMIARGQTADLLFRRNASIKMNGGSGALHSSYALVELRDSLVTISLPQVNFLDSLI